MVFSQEEIDCKTIKNELTFVLSQDFKFRRVIFHILNDCINTSKLGVEYSLNEINRIQLQGLGFTLGLSYKNEGYVYNGTSSNATTGIMSGRYSDFTNCSEPQFTSDELLAIYGIYNYTGPYNISYDALGSPRTDNYCLDAPPPICGTGLAQLWGLE